MLSAECQLRAGHKQWALALYQTLSQRAGASAEVAGFEAAKLQVELGQKAEGLAAFEAVLTRFPSGRLAAEAGFRRCELLIELKRLPEARACLERYASTQPANTRTAESVFLLATLARIEHRFADAALSYGRSAEFAGPRAEEAAYQQVACTALAGSADLDAVIGNYLKRYPTGPHSAEVTKLRR